MRDLSGVVNLSGVAGPHASQARHFELTYTPLAASTLGDAALAALIGKAEKVQVDNADEIVITLGSRSLSQGQRKGTRTDRLKFNMRGVWQETYVDVDWE